MSEDQIGLVFSGQKGALMPLSVSALSRTVSAWVVTAASLLSVLGLAAATPAVADTCPNAALRAQNASTELPDCRAYEMVTPPYKQGFSVDIKTFADDGAVSYVSTGNFAGNLFGQGQNQYLATRSATGWVTSSLNPPAETYVSLLGFGAEAQSPDLRWSLFLMYPRGDAPASGLLDYYLRSPDGTFTRVGKEPGTTGANAYTAGTSADLSHVIFQHENGGGNAVMAAMYEFVGTGNQGLPRPVSIDNTGASTEGEACAKATSADGRVIVFSSRCDRAGLGLQLWARVGGSATVAVSGSECTRVPADTGGACNDLSAAQFVGAAKDGSRVFFTTDQQLVNGDTDQTSDLYACDIPAGAPAPTGSSNPCAALTQVSGTAVGAQVETVPVVSEDGSRVYFVAQGAALTNSLGVNGAAPVAGQHNLYVWTADAAHPAGQIRFVAPLDTVDMFRSQLTPDGRYLAFSTAAKLVTSGPGADSDDARDMYRYDATTHTVIRLSTSVAGGGGNANGVDATALQPIAVRLMSADGSLVAFETAEGLSPRDTNGVTDVYAWHDGRVSLISDGGGQLLWVTPSGRDIFFITGQAVTAADGDVNGDIYSARVGGGFDLTRPAPCSGDGCQRPSSEAPGLSRPGSGPLGAGDAGEVAPVLSLRTVSAAQRRRLAETGKIALTVVANMVGTVRATATATIAGRSLTVASARRTMTRPGSETVALTLSRKARAQLTARGKLTVRLSVTHSKAALGRSVTVRLTHAKAKKSSVGGRS